MTRRNVGDWYQSAFGRAPDAAGQQFWQSAINNGGDPNKIYSDFIAAGIRNGEKLVTPGQAGTSQAGAGQAAPAASAAPLPTPTAATYTAPVLGDPSKWNVTPDQTVEGRVQGIIANGGPLMQQAQTAGLESAASRGLANSSMAVGAAQNALYSAAVPIATADAQTEAAAGQLNTNTENQFKLSQAGLDQSAGQFNAGAENTLAGQKLASDTSITTAGIGANTQLEAAKLSSQTQQNIAQLQAGTQSNIANLDAQTKVALGNLDANTRTQIANLDSQTRQLTATNSSASNLFQTYMQQIAAITTSTMDQAAKDQAVQNAISDLHESLNAMGSISGVDFSKYFNAVPAATTPPATTPASTAQNTNTVDFNSINGGGGG
jgi:hypothetical protein